MLRKMREAREAESGFTLIELLIVIVILGILAAIVVFAVGGITDRGQVSACKADKKTIETAVEAYYAKNTGYPASLAALSPDFLHADNQIAGNTKTVSGSNGYTLTYSPTGANAGTVTSSLATCN